MGEDFIPLAPLGSDEGTEDAPRDVNLGRTITLNPPTVASGSYANPVGGPADLVWCTFKGPRHATVILQTTTPQTGPGVGVYVTITTSIGGSARFVRQFFLPPGPAKYVQVFGSLIQVSALLSGPVGSTPVTQVSGAIVSENVDPLGSLATQWQASATGIASAAWITLAAQNGITQQGFFLGCSGFLMPGTGTAGTNYYWMVFDVNLSGGGLANGDKPLLALGPLVGGQASSFSFDRSLRPSVPFTQSLQWALSTTADVYTAVTDGAKARTDADYGI
jgi:hypothetical protein